MTTTARIFSIVLFPMTLMMNGIMKKCLDGDMEDLKNAIESQDALT